ncbi:helix-turn-helix domain-containing protein [Anaerococcus hydrogenalis]|nr:helix-turn-helix domain-containing protein [Anaerococcus hydrogenalis]MDK7695062.1 helix-turn-helix domain-containing protein [Anaerococcus hydrogenalis]MDK7696963.1 helix-turn-helix domain-containing protein [Anaerococcus hydrogenalis]MDK7708089.1 helix-turn-helix domain-containing protein [Anaerococcus hydrogenalis]
MNNATLRDPAEHFNLVNESMVYIWDKAYQEHSLSGLEDKRGRPKKD